MRYKKDEAQRGSSNIPRPDPHRGLHSQYALAVDERVGLSYDVEDLGPRPFCFWPPTHTAVSVIFDTAYSLPSRGRPGE